MGDAAYADTWADFSLPSPLGERGRGEGAATRIVECIPQAFGGTVWRVGFRAGVSQRRAATRGLIAVPWPPASLSLLPERRKTNASLTVEKFTPGLDCPTAS